MRWRITVALTAASLVGSLTGVAAPANANVTGGPIKCVASGNNAADAYNAAFGSPMGFWQAGDVPQNYPLPDGRVLWILNDSYLNKTSPGGRLTGSSFVRNVAVMQHGNCFEVMAGIKSPDPKVPIDPRNPPPNAEPESFYAADEQENSAWWWAHGGVVEGDFLNIFFTLMRQTGPVGWAVNFAPSTTAVVTYNWHTMELVGTQAAPNRGVNPIYGYSVVNDESWTYLFGASDDLRINHSSVDDYVARVPKGQVTTAAPTYWNGKTWVANAAAAKSISHNGSFAHRLSVMYDDERWVAVSKDDEFFGTNLLVWEAPEAQGPWVITQRLPLATKTNDGATVTYEPVLFPTLKNGKLLVNWSNNHFEFAPVANNPSLYRPTFAEVALGPPTQTNDICHGEQTGRAVNVLNARTPSRFMPIAPARVFDSRSTGARTAANTAVTIDVAAALGAPKASVAAVTLNVTLNNTAAPGYATVWPAANPPPGTSNVNADRAGATVANLVTVPVDSAGRVSIITSMATHVIVDAFGWYEHATRATAGRITSVAPTRLLDTRSTGAVRPSGSTTPVAIAGRAGVPAMGAAAAVLNLTATDVRGEGYVTVSPTAAVAATSNLNVAAHETRANQVMVPIGSDGSIYLFNAVAAHLIVDIVGYVTDASAPPSASGLFVPVDPVRVLDSRGAPGVPAIGCIATVPIPALPLGTRASAAVTNVTLTANTRPGYATAWPHGAPTPAVSTLNVDKSGQSRPNHAVVPLGTDGSFDVLLQARTHLIVDLTGYIT